jgi:2-C-methyl-D-erythritol 4-phosphate cytidylyltransferase
MSSSFTKVSQAAIIVAAGSGTRMGSLSLKHGVPKVLFPLGNSTAVAMSVQAFIDAGVSKVVVVVRESYRCDFYKALEGFEPPPVIVAGGATRSDSVRAGLKALSTLHPSALIAVHDAARCFCTKKLIQDCFEAAAKYGAATAAIPAIDTVVLAAEVVASEESASDTGSTAEVAGSSATSTVAPGTIEILLPRERVWQVQTPQVFRAELLRKAHHQDSPEQDSPEVPLVATDDASLVQELHPVTLVTGERSNFKITTVEDYQMALALTGGTGA